MVASVSSATSFRRRSCLGPTIFKGRPPVQGNGSIEPLSRLRCFNPRTQDLLTRYFAATSPALVGDAAGYLDALSGQGLELGFAAAAALIEILKSGAPLSHYEQAYRRLSRRYYLGTELLLQLTRHRQLRRGFLRLLHATPALSDRLLGALDPRERLLAAAPVSPDAVTTRRLASSKRMS